MVGTTYLHVRGTEEVEVLYKNTKIYSRDVPHIQLSINSPLATYDMDGGSSLMLSFSDEEGVDVLRKLVKAASAALAKVDEKLLPRIDKLQGRE